MSANLHIDATSTNSTPGLSDTTIGGNPVTCKPYILFFYGTTIPHVLKQVLALPTDPTLTLAFIHGYVIRLWDPYPTLLSSDSDAKVNGMLFKVETLEWI
jgi:hypothetical protein